MILFQNKRLHALVICVKQTNLSFSFMQGRKRKRRQEMTLESSRVRSDLDSLERKFVIEERSVN